MSFHNYGVLIKIISGRPCFGVTKYRVGYKDITHFEEV